jgi:hypothetical protein
MSWSPSQLLVWPNSTSNASPVGAITLPSGRVGAEVERLLGEAAEADAADDARLGEARGASCRPSSSSGRSTLVNLQSLPQTLVPSRAPFQDLWFRAVSGN